MRVMMIKQRINKNVIILYNFYPLHSLCMPISNVYLMIFFKHEEVCLN